MILFYREQQSVECVATALELSEDAVHQRLSRGRKLLSGEVTAFVEGALAKTSPGKNFTLGVIAALPLASTSAKAATLGGALAKAGATAKGVATIGSLGGLLATVGALYFSLRADADDTKSPREREFLRRMMGFQIIFYVLILASLLAKGKIFSELSGQPLVKDMAVAAYFFLCVAHGSILFDYISRRQRQIQIEDATFDAAEWTRPRQETESRPGKSDGKTKLGKFSQALRFVALPLIVVLMFPYWHASPNPNLHVARSLVTDAGGLLIFAVVFGFLMLGGWQRCPRFLSVTPPRRRFGVVIGFGSLTLLALNIHQFMLPAASAAAVSMVILFNAAVILAYAVLVGIMIWNRPASAASTSSES